MASYKGKITSTTRRRFRQRMIPLPVSLPAMGIMLQALVFWFATMLVSVFSWRGSDAMWWEANTSDQFESIASLVESFWLIHILWSVLMVVHIAKELRFPHPERRVRLKVDYTALALALFMVYGAYLFDLAILGPATGPSPYLIHEFRFDPATQKWWLQ